MRGGREGGAVADLDQDSSCSPDADAGHRGQDRGKRVVIDDPLRVRVDRFPLLKSLFQGAGEFGKNGFGGRGAGHHHGLLVEGGKDVGGQPGAYSGCVLERDRCELALAGLPDSGWPAAAGEDLEHRRMGDAGPEDPLEGGVDGGERVSDAVADPGGLAGEVVVEPDEDLDFDDAAHRQSGQVADVVAAYAGTVTGRAPIVLGWSTTTSTDPWLARRPNTARSFASSFGNALS